MVGRLRNGKVNGRRQPINYASVIKEHSYSLPSPRFTRKIRTKTCELKVSSKYDFTFSFQKIPRIEEIVTVIKFKDAETKCSSKTKHKSSKVLSAVNRKTKLPLSLITQNKAGRLDIERQTSLTQTSKGCDRVFHSTPIIRKGRPKKSTQISHVSTIIKKEPISDEQTSTLTTLPYNLRKRNYAIEESAINVANNEIVPSIFNDVEPQPFELLSRLVPGNKKSFEDNRSKYKNTKTKCTKKSKSLKIEELKKKYGIKSCKIKIKYDKELAKTAHELKFRKFMTLRSGREVRPQNCKPTTEIISEPCELDELSELFLACQSGKISPGYKTIKEKLLEKKEKCQNSADDSDLYETFFNENSYFFKDLNIGDMTVEPEDTTKKNLETGSVQFHSFLPV